MDKILPHLDEDEMSVYKRGRNVGHTSIPKSSSAVEYRRATGLETLFGWLYLQGRKERIDELFISAFEQVNTETEGEQDGK